MPPLRQTAALLRRAAALGPALLLVGACGDPHTPGGAAGNQQPLYSFAAHASSARVVSEKAAVAFARAADRELLVSGWGAAERPRAVGAGFAWAVSPVAGVELRLVRGGRRTLRFRCAPYAYPGSPGQSVQVEANGVAAGGVELHPGPREYSLELPAGCLRAGVNRLVLRFAWSASPSDHEPGSADRRTLAAAFEWLRLEDDEQVRSQGGPAAGAGTDDIEVTAGSARVYQVGIPAEGALVLGADPGSDGAEVWLVGTEGAAQRLFPDPDRDQLRADLAGRAGQVVELWFATGRQPAVFRSPRLLGAAGRLDLATNLVLVVVDTLRADYIGCYGGTVATPVMDRLAASGVRFSRAYSHVPITGPSHASLFTSRLPLEHGVHNNAQVLRPQLGTLAESLRAWYRSTAAVVSLGVLKPEYGLDRGFDTYAASFGLDWFKDAGEVTDTALGWLATAPAEPFFLWVHYSDPHEPYAPAGINYPLVAITLGGTVVDQFAVDGRSHAVKFTLRPGHSVLHFQAEGAPPSRELGFFDLRLVGGSCTWRQGGGWTLDDKRLGPARLTTRLPARLEVDNPTGQPQAVELRFYSKEILSVQDARARYSLEVENVDRQLGRLLETLRSRGVLDRSLLVLVSDHGEGLGDHRLLGHTTQLYDSLLRVPLVISYPSRLPAGRVVDEPVALVDVMPTVLDALRLPAQPGCRGRSLMPLIAGQPQGTVPVFAATFRPEAEEDLLAIVSGGFKLIVAPGAPPRRELYDLGADPRELANLTGSAGELMAMLSAELERELARSKAGGTTAPTAVPLDQEELARMRALGYLQ